MVEIMSCTKLQIVAITHVYRMNILAQKLKFSAVPETH